MLFNWEWFVGHIIVFWGILLSTNTKYTADLAKIRIRIKYFTTEQELSPKVVYQGLSTTNLKAQSPSTTEQELSPEGVYQGSSTTTLEDQSPSTTEKDL